MVASTRRWDGSPPQNRGWWESPSRSHFLQIFGPLCRQKKNDTFESERERKSATAVVGMFGRGMRLWTGRNPRCPIGKELVGGLLCDWTIYSALPGSGLALQHQDGVRSTVALAKRGCSPVGPLSAPHRFFFGSRFLRHFKVAVSNFNRGSVEASVSMASTESSSVGRFSTMWMSRLTG